MAELSVVGKNVTKIEAVSKVTGKLKYASEEGIGVPGMLCGKVLFSPHAHAKILNINISKASRLKGVRAVLTGKDTPNNRTGMLIDDRHVLCHETVRFVGDAVAVVAADTVEAAEEAIKLIDIKYEILPAIFDAEEAMKPDCPVVVHPDLPNYNRPLYSYMGNDLPGPNVHTHHKVRKGNIGKAFQEADLIVENRFQGDRITHCQLEPYNSVCYPESDGTLTVWTSARLRETLEPLLRAFNLNPNKIRLRNTYLGGMFGLLGRPERFTLLIALKTGKPVRIVYTREENFIDGFNRLPKVIYVKDGLKRDGTIIAREIKVIINTGAYGGHAPLTIRNGAFHASQYRIPNYKWDAYGVYTNEPPCGPLRGFGSAEVLWATEQQMDINAKKLGIDPYEFRMKNTVDEGEIDVRGQRVHSIGAKECLNKVAEWIDWGKPSVQPAEKHIKVGKGLAIGNKYTMADTASSAVVKVQLDGTIEIAHGGDDCGQGLNTILAQMAAEELKVPIEKIKIVWGDSHRTPYDFGTASSRSSLYIGNAVILACKDAKKHLFELAAKQLETTPDNIDYNDGKLFTLSEPKKPMALADLALGRQPDVKGAVKGATCLTESAEIIGQGVFWGRPSAEDPETGQGSRLTMSYAYGAQAVEVAVDTETGIVKILRIGSAFDVGKTLHPKMCEAQIEGGVAMGIGSALYEGFVFDNKGRVLNTNYHDYRICSMLNVPTGDDIKSMMVETIHPEGPFGSKGVGESSMCPTAPAIANAIYNAIGVRLTHLPMTPERIVKAIKESKKSSINRQVKR
jgi:CO/xanthine dehydrogenase Mo-binding subunit